MPLTFADATVTLSGVITVEDAEPLAQWLRTTPDPVLRMAECTHLHTAALQALMAARPVLAAPPTEPFLARWVAPLIAAPAGDLPPGLPPDPDVPPTGAEPTRQETR